MLVCLTIELWEHMGERVFPDRIERMLEVFAFLPAYEGRGLFLVELEKLIGTEFLERTIQRACDRTRGREVICDDRRLEDLKVADGEG